MRYYTMPIGHVVQYITAHLRGLVNTVNPVPNHVPLQNSGRMVSALIETLERPAGYFPVHLRHWSEIWDGWRPGSLTPTARGIQIMPVVHGIARLDSPPAATAPDMPLYRVTPLPH
jgi:hypothetical protein